MSMTNDEAWPDLMVTKEAARYLRLSVPTLERLRMAGGPPFIKLTPGKRGRVVYRRADLDAYLVRCRRATTSEQW